MFDLSYPKITAQVTNNGSNLVEAFKIFGVDSANVDLESDQPAPSAEAEENSVCEDARSIQRCVADILDATVKE